MFSLHTVPRISFKPLLKTGSNTFFPLILLLLKLFYRLNYVCIDKLYHLFCYPLSQIFACSKTVSLNKRVGTHFWVVKAWFGSPKYILYYCLYGHKIVFYSVKWVASYRCLIKSIAIKHFIFPSSILNKTAMPRSRNRFQSIFVLMVIIWTYRLKRIRFSVLRTLRALLQYVTASGRTVSWNRKKNRLNETTNRNKLLFILAYKSNWIFRPNVMEFS